jgi:hypothetical protein
VDRELNVHHVGMQVDPVVQLGGMNVSVVDLRAAAEEALGVRVLTQPLSSEEFSRYPYLSWIVEGVLGQDTSCRRGEHH